MKGNEHATCPRCGKGASGFTNVNAESSYHPKEGDIAVCAYCGGTNLYRADLTLRLPTAAELGGVSAAIQKALDAMLEARH